MERGYPLGRQVATFAVWMDWACAAGRSHRGILPPGMLERWSTGGGWKPSTCHDACCFGLEMRLPGYVWLEFRAEPDGAGTRFMPQARFVPSGLFGHLY